MFFKYFFTSDVQPPLPLANISHEVISVQTMQDLFILPSNVEQIKHKYWNGQNLPNIKIKSKYVTTTSLKRLDGSQSNVLNMWLDDAVINAYFVLIVERAELSSNLKSVI